jgi:peptide/nickel transport system permease protein
MTPRMPARATGGRAADLAAAEAASTRPRRGFRIPVSVWIAAAVVVLAVTLALLAEVVAPYSYSDQSLLTRLLPPAFLDGDPAHLLGTDVLGRDILSRLFVGLRASLAAGFGGVGVACALGTVVGLVAGYYRGWIENVLMLIVDVKLALPGILLAIGIIAVLGSSGVVLVLVIGLGLWTGFARIVRSIVIRLRNEEFVTAARAVGAGEGRIIRRHILPNCATPIIVLATLDIPTAVALEASLSFLGVGIQPPIPSLGNMIADGRQYLDTQPLQTIIPAVVLVVITLSVSRIGDWLSDVLDPSSQRGAIE